MKALQCTELGGPEKLSVNEIDDPVIAAEHVIIDVRSASVNFTDVFLKILILQSNFEPPDLSVVSCLTQFNYTRTEAIEDPNSP